MKSEQLQILSKKYPHLFNQLTDTENGNITSVTQFSEAVKQLIKLCGDDPERDGLLDTPFRVLKAFLEYTEGYNKDPKIHLEKTFDIHHKGLILIKDIEFYSLCEHHFSPFFGVAHIGYIPKEKITGLSKMGRLVEGYAKRFQVQERLTTQIAEAIEEVLDPEGTIVVVEAKHMCMCSRGIKKANTVTTTSSLLGIYENRPDLRAEFYSLIKTQGSK
ncbi:GTP cyclohydrolase I FolE [Neobacillus sp. 179-C4.2 HS]|uniref:GTP cyclohydrolase 1 n=1 Tax=Neobacillus driksii TaxID=3035913 RepID=A0ABV4YR11_9BACI|nr:GTP cyclohydrolase I FolE [Neobacillus sp. 179.-C4.2 HS]MDP5197027.1 GTP cyclohydrolase I FolE [Neobacillus sp. 179.-C4.2 HS]